jgi:chromosome segregation ATPase
MFNPPSPGVTRPVAGSKDPKKTNTASSGYQGREMDAMKKKQEEERLHKIVTLGQQLNSKKLSLKDEQDKQVKLRFELSRLEGQTRTTSASNRPVAEVKNLERQNTTKIAEDERKIEALEQEMAGLDRNTETKKVALIAQKVQEEKQDAKHITDIKEEIRRKTLELAAALSEDKELQKEIINLKSQSKNSGSATGHPELKATEQQNTQKASEIKLNIERLKTEIAGLGQNLEIKKQQVEKTVKDSLQSKEQEIQTKNQDLALAVNRMRALEISINGLEHDIQTLKNGHNV